MLSLHSPYVAATTDCGLSPAVPAIASCALVSLPGMSVSDAVATSPCSLCMWAAKRARHACACTPRIRRGSSFWRALYIRTSKGKGPSSQGAADLTSPANLSALTGILAIEAYHAGSIREQLIQIHKSNIAEPFFHNVWEVVQVHTVSCMSFEGNTAAQPSSPCSSAPPLRGSSLATSNSAQIAVPRPCGNLQDRN